MLASGLFLLGVFFYAHLRHVRVKQLKLGFFLIASLLALLASIILVVFKYNKHLVQQIFNIMPRYVDQWLDQVAILAAVVIAMLVWIVILWRLANWVSSLLHRKHRKRRKLSKPGV